jgi:hypothetical protein
MPEVFVGKCECPSWSPRPLWLRGMIVVAAMVCVSAAEAQTTRPELRLGIGTFLSRDRGWNYHEQIEVFAALAQNAGPVNVEAGASLFKCFCGNLSYPAVSPPYPRPYQDGFAARLHVRTPGPTRSALSALLGAELIHNRTTGEAKVTTAAGTAGVGVNFGPGRRGALDLRYVRFARPLGSSRGILPLTLAWRL